MSRRLPENRLILQKPGIGLAFVLPETCMTAAMAHTIVKESE